MALSDIDIQWMGYRKDGGKGTVVGWFVPTGCPTKPLERWEEKEYGGPATAYFFRGRIGKKMTIEEKVLTHDFIRGFGTFEKNYKTVEPEKITKIWGTAINEELSQFILMMKLKNPCKPKSSEIGW
jgi:hypothetical protein